MDDRSPHQASSSSSTQVPEGTEPVANTSDKRADDIGMLSHYETGLPFDGVIYRNDQGQRVKLDKNGKPYPVDSDGIRRDVGRGSSRPEGVPLEVWNYIRPILAKKGQTYREYMAER
jgi:hypothetical protein